MHLRGIRREEVRQWWPKSWPMLKPAVDMIGQHTPLSVLSALEDGDFQLWAVLDDDGNMHAAVVTEIAEWPGTKECTSRYCGGDDVDEWVDLIAEIEAWAKHNGCTRSYVMGRRGWTKKLHGYRESAVVLMKDLCDA